MVTLAPSSTPLMPVLFKFRGIQNDPALSSFEYALTSCWFPFEEKLSKEVGLWTVEISTPTKLLKTRQYNQYAK